MCWKTGHLQAMCRGFLAGTDPAPGAGVNSKTTTATATPPLSGTFADQWMCETCWVTCEDKHAQKCPGASGRAKKEARPKEPQSADTKTSISKAAQKVMKPEEEKTEEVEKPGEQSAEIEKQASSTKK